MSAGLLGALIGGAISFCATWLQLRHASKEARLAREHALKREVYFEAAEGMARGVQLLTSFHRSDLTIQQLSDIPSGNPGWDFRVHIVGDLETIKALDQAFEFLSSCALDLMPRKVNLDMLRDAAAAIFERATQLGTRGEQLVAIIQGVSAPDATPEARVLAQQLTQDIRAVHAELTEVSRDHHRASGRKLRAERDMVVACRKAVAEHQRFLAQAIVHIRRELGLPLDEKDYLAHVEQSSVRSLARLKELVDSLDQLDSE